MYNPFNLIPITIDPKLRSALISLIIIQFLAFIILISYLTYEFVLYKINSKKIDKMAEENEELRKKENEMREPVKFDNEEIEEDEEEEKNLNEAEKIEQENILLERLKQDDNNNNNNTIIDKHSRIKAE